MAFHLNGFKEGFKDVEKESSKDPVTLKTLYDAMKSDKLGLHHKDFTEIAKKMEETDTFMNRPFDVSEGVNQCSKCKSFRTFSFCKQTRGSDEPVSVFITCVDCKYRCIVNN
jgi:DNA-directed RNA polymerase subunit M/transcription elongation factor TFIIS